MATLTSTKIKNTYDALLKASDNDAIGSSAKQITDGLGNGTPLYISTTQIGIGVTPEATYDLHVYSNAKVGGNLTVTGDLTVDGTVTTVSSETLTVTDPLIELAKDNTSTDALDIGFYGKYAPSGTTLYAGLFRDTGDSKFKLFRNLEEQPTTTVNTSGTGYTVATLVADVEGTLTGTIASSTVATTQSANDNSTKVATTAYVDNQVTLQDLDITDGTNNGSVDLDSQVLTFTQTANETTVEVNGQEVTFGLPSSISVNVTGDLTGDVYNADGSIILNTGDNSIDAVLSNGVRATTQSQGDNSTKVATTAYVDTTTGNYLPLSGGTITGELELNDILYTRSNLRVLNAAGTGWHTWATRASGKYDLNVNNVTGNLTATSVLEDGVTATTQTQGDNSTKVATTAYVDSAIGGQDTLAEILANGNTTGGTDIAVSSGDDITFADDSKTIYGAGSDLQIYHDSTTNDSIIKESGAGHLKLLSNFISLKNVDDTETMLSAEEDGSVSLYFNNVTKLSTNNLGVTLNGNLFLPQGDYISFNQGAPHNHTIERNGNDLEFNTGGDFVFLSGQMKLDTYGSGTYTGTATYRLAVDSSGDVIEIPIGGGAVDGSGTANYVTKWSDTDTITNSVIYDNGNIGINETNPASDLVVRADSAGGRGGEITILNYASTTVGNEAALNFGLESSTYAGNDANAQIKAIISGSLAATDMVFTNWSGSAFNENMRIDSSGRVAIGTDSPFSTAKLQIKTATNVNLAFQTGTTETSGFKINAFNDAANANIPLELNGSVVLLKTGETERMRITSGGKVGIDETNPLAKLVVNQDSLVDTEGLWVQASNNPSDGGVAIFKSASKVGSIQSLGANSSLSFITNSSGTNTERMRIGSSGNVLINNTTDNTYDKLQVIGNAYIGGNATRGVRIADGGTYASMVGINQAVTAYTGLELRASGTNGQLFLSTNGNVGIGETNPLSDLTVRSDSAGGRGGEITILNYASTTVGNEAALNFGLEASTYQADNGNAQIKGIVTDASNAASQMRFSLWNGGSFNEEFRMDNNGDFHALGDVVAYSTTISDARLKDNVKPLESSLDKIMNLKGVEYTWNNGSRKGQKDIGFIAQEVEDVIPEIVREKKVIFDDDTEYKTVDYEKITAVLVEAVKELKQEIVELKKQIK